MVGSDPSRRVDPLRGARRRHADVCQDGLGEVSVDGRHQLVVRGDHRNEVDLAGGGEERRRSLAHKVVILREDHAYHAGIVQASKGRAA
jgi:hypothetical protein